MSYDSPRQTLVFLSIWSPRGTFLTSKEAPQVRAPRRRTGTLKQILRFLACSYIHPRSKNGVQQKYILFAELDLKLAKLGSASSSFFTNLPKTLLTMKIITKSSLGNFKKVPEFLHRSTDRSHLDPGGSLPIFSWMKWHHTGFHSLFSLFRVSSSVGDYWVVCLFVFLVLLRFSYLPGRPS